MCIYFKTYIWSHAHIYMWTAICVIIKHRASCTIIINGVVIYCLLTSGSENEREQSTHTSEKVILTPMKVSFPRYERTSFFFIQVPGCMHFFCGKVMIVNDEMAEVSTTSINTGHRQMRKVRERTRNSHIRRDGKRPEILTK